MKDPFKTIYVGQEAEIIHTITADDIDNFAKLSGDTNPLHMDESFAATTSFRHRVSHGMLTASFISTMIGTKLPGKGSLWFEQHLRFLAPARVGEKIRVYAHVTQKSEAQRVVTLLTQVFGSDERQLIEGEAKVKMLEIKEESAMSKKKTDKHAVIVSGASRGIGAAIARELAAQGYPIIVNSHRNIEQGEKVVSSIVSSGGKAFVFQADMTDSAAIRAMVEAAIHRYSALAGIVNNASAPVIAADTANLPWAEVQKHLDVQVKGVLLLSQAVLPHLIESGGGVIVSIGSAYAHGVPPTKMLAYTVAKAALSAMTRSLAADFGPRHIRVNCVAPGMTETDFISEVPEKTKLMTKMNTPLRQLGQPEDIAGLVAFLFDDKARHITGQTLHVGGGSIMS